MSRFNILYQKEYNNFKFNFGHTKIILNFFELRILKQNLHLLKPISKQKNYINVKFDTVTVQFNTKEFILFFNFFLKFYNTLVNEYKIKINSKLINKNLTSS